MSAPIRLRRASRRPGWLVHLLVVAAGVLVLAGAATSCSSTPTLDRATTEAAVARAADRAISPRVTRATCPDGVVRRAGATFRCRVTVAGVGTARVSVRQVDAEGRLVVRPVDAVLADAAVADELRATLRTRFGRTFQVTCGDHPWRIWAPGDTFPCRARDRDGRRSVDVTVVDGAGTLSFAVLRPGR